jgi:hypothetical protein
MPESCSNYPPTRSKVLQSGSDNPAFYSEKYPVNKFNTTTHSLTVASDTLAVATHSEDSAGRSENSRGYSKNIQTVSYACGRQVALVPVISEKSRPGGLLSNKRLVFLNTETETKP